jgi:phosphodiesterase/alkaline phosphatase D-like protein
MIAALMAVTGFSFNAAIAWQQKAEDAKPGVIEQLKQALNGRDQLEFVAIGDTGSRLPGQYTTAKALAKTFEDKPFEFVLLLGDNIYPYGDVNKYGEASFTQPYAPLLKAGVPFYVSLGNHDVLFGHKAAQIKFFKMPSAYYAIKKGTADFFVIDTNDFDATQQQWLTQALKTSKAPWKIVFGHHPILSSGKHGHNKQLLATLAPILTAQKVPLYLAGHDHNYERFKPQQGVTYVVSGGGGASLRSMDAISPESEYHKSTHHFVRFVVTPKQLKAEAIDSDQTVIDRFTFSR